MILNHAAHWSLHPQLAADTVAVGDLSLSRVLVMNDANYPWLILTPRQIGAMEVIDLADTEQARLMVEIAQAARALKEVTDCDKLNIAALGNVVPQLHVHVIARRKDDPAWPAPVWGYTAARAYEPAALDHLVACLRGRLGLAGGC
jgi:diadenosine tetraphosphate (Ap4A) HIT family hydrolase